MVLLIRSLVGKHRVWWHSAAALFWLNILITTVEGKQPAREGCFSYLKVSDTNISACIFFPWCYSTSPTLNHTLNEDQCERLEGFFFFFSRQLEKFNGEMQNIIVLIRCLWNVTMCYEGKQTFKFCEGRWRMDGRQRVWIENHKTQ